MKNGPTNVDIVAQKISKLLFNTNLSWRIPYANIRIKVTNELAEYIVPTSLPDKPRPFFSEVSQIWKNDHQMDHDAKNINKVNEDCK